MFIEHFKMRLAAGWLLTTSLTLTCLGQSSTSGTPSPGLKEADAAYRTGVAAMSHGDWNAARYDFEKVVKLAPAVEQGHSALGATLLHLGLTNEAIRQLESALAIQPDESSAQLNLALAYEQSGRPQKALPWFAKVMVASRAQKRVLPSNVVAAYARALAATQQYAAAVARMKEAAASDPTNADLEDELGSLYAQHQDWSNANNAFTTALRLKPDSAVAHLHLGVALTASGQPGGLEELSKAYQLGPDNAVITMEYGRALAGAGQDTQAIPVLQHAVELDPRFAEAKYQLGLALQRSDRAADAIPLFEAAADAEPQNAEILTNFGMALCQAQRAKDAVPILQRATRIAPASVTAHENLAAAYIQLSQLDDAVVELRAALKLSPNRPQLHYNLGLALKMQDDGAAAIPELETAERLDPSAAEAPYVLGVLYLQAGRYADAERELNTSLKLRPQNGEGWATLGSVDSNLNRLQDAENALREAIRQLPLQPDPHLTLAAVLVKENQTAAAAEERKTAAGLMRSNMNRQRAEVAGNSATSLLKSGKLGDAVTGFEEALRFDPSYAEAHRGLAAALEQEGKTADAAVERQKAEALEKGAP